MGDRRMAKIRTKGGSIFVYTHWRGSFLPQDAEAAIAAAKPRWGDHSYAARIIVDQLTKEGRDQTTGFGLMVKPLEEDEYNDNNPSVIIDLIEKTLTVIQDGSKRTRTFDEIVQVAPPGET